MAIYAIRFIFNWGRAGWSEGHYLESSQTTPQEVYANSATFGRLIIARAQLLSGGGANAQLSDVANWPILEGFRITLAPLQTDKPGKQRPEYGGATGGAATANVKNPFRGARNSGPILRMQTTGNTARRMETLLGLPEEWIDLSLASRKSAVLRKAAGTAALTAYRNVIVDRMGNSDFRLKRSVRVDPGNPRVVSVVRNATTDRIVLNMEDDHGFVINDRIALRGFRKLGLKGFTGITRVYNVVGPVVTLYRRACEPCMVPGTVYYIDDASAWKVQIAYEPVALCEMSGWGSKKPGGAFFVEPGRRVNKQRCC